MCTVTTVSQKYLVWKYNVTIVFALAIMLHMIYFYLKLLFTLYQAVITISCQRVMFSKVSSMSMVHNTMTKFLQPCSNCYNRERKKIMHFTVLGNKFWLMFCFLFVLFFSIFFSFFLFSFFWGGGGVGVKVMWAQWSILQ